MGLKRKGRLARRRLSRRRPTRRASVMKIANRPLQSIVFVEEEETDHSMDSNAMGTYPLSLRRMEEDDEQD
jgi:hypothetical protein